MPTSDPWDGSTWSVTAPDTDQPAGNAFKEIYDLRKGVAIRINKEHETLAASSAGGVHKQGSARCFFQDTAPATQVDGSAFDSGDLGLLWIDSNSSPDNQYNILTATTPTWTPISTEVIAVLLASARTFASTLTVTGLLTANGGVTLGAGDDLIGSATSDVAINTDKFTVAGATGNTGIGGTLGVTGVATLGDDSALATSAAPDADAKLANKKYVDDQLAFSAYTTEDSNADAMVKAQAYLAQTDGFVRAVADMGVGDFIKGYIDGTDDPAGAGELYNITHQAGNDGATCIMEVAAGEYFEFTTDFGGDLTIYWRSRGPLSKPIDQD